MVPDGRKPGVNPRVAYQVAMWLSHLLKVRGRLPLQFQFRPSRHRYALPASGSLSFTLRALYDLVRKPTLAKQAGHRLHRGINVLEKGLYPAHR